MHAFTTAVVIGTGGFCGAVLRYWVSSGIKRLTGEDWAFVGTMTVNLVGCLMIGTLLVLYARHRVLSPAAFQFLVVGLVGSLTTFSTFAAETLDLLRFGRPGAAALHVGANLVIGLSLVWIGAAITTNLLPAGGNAV